MVVQTETTQGESLSTPNRKEIRQIPSSSRHPTANHFSKELRLLKPKEFSYVFADAQRFANRNWTLIVRPNQLTIPRLGLAIA